MCGKWQPYCLSLNAARETNTHPLLNLSAFWAGRVANWPGRVEFCVEYIKDICFQASPPKILFPTLQCVKASGAGPICIQDTNLIIIVAADAATMMMIIWTFFHPSCLEFQRLHATLVAQMTKYKMVKEI